MIKHTNERTIARKIMEHENDEHVEWSFFKLQSLMFHVCQYDISIYITVKH